MTGTIFSLVGIVFTVVIGVRWRRHLWDRRGRRQRALGGTFGPGRVGRRCRAASPRPPSWRQRSQRALVAAGAAPTIPLDTPPSATESEAAQHLHLPGRERRLQPRSARPTATTPTACASAGCRRRSPPCRRGSSRSPPSRPSSARPQSDSVVRRVGVSFGQNIYTPARHRSRRSPSTTTGLMRRGSMPASPCNTPTSGATRRPGSRSRCGSTRCSSTSA